MQRRAMKNRAYNFGAGPAMLPDALLLEAQAELLNWQGEGMSVMEIGHRTPEYMALMEEIEADFRELLAIPKNYTVLFIPSPGRTQFAMIPMNLLSAGQQGGYLVSGMWSAMALEEAEKLKLGYCVSSSEDTGFTDIPSPSSWKLQENTAYLYFTANETVHGVRFAQTPHAETIPLVADMTSCILSEPINVSDYGLIFAGAQKNISIPGLTIVIIRSDLLDKTPASTVPTMLDYRTHATHHSLYATPPAFNCYLAGKMFKWIKEQGGIKALYKINCQKAAMLYDYIDNSSFYHCAVKPSSRSIMNVCFSLTQKELETEFLEQANQHGLYALKGHRAVGGMRASLYNAMPMAGVESLVAFMQTFAKDHS